MTPEETVAAVAEAHGLTVDDLTGRDQTDEVTAARHEAMRLLRDDGLSYTQIGLLLHRDHSTVMAAVHGHKKRPPVSSKDRKVPYEMEMGRRLDRVDPAPGWMAKARCRGLDPELFHPEDNTGVKAAKAICADCPVKQDCLDQAIRAHEPYAIWGGLTVKQRQKVARDRQRTRQNRRVG